MTAFSITQLRLQNQHLLNPEFTSPADIVRHMGVVQSQDYTGAKWALGQRLKNATDDLIDKVFSRWRHHSHTCAAPNLAFCTS
jgi:hypothetical protein